MNAILDIKLLSWILDKLISYRDKHKEHVNEAINAIHSAWGTTYDYLKNNDGAFVPNPELSALWREAAYRTRLVDRDLASKLDSKSRFWIHPSLPRQDNILKLTEIVDELERLNRKF